MTSRQAGVALLLCLLFLTAMTLTGLNASADAILQNQLAANLKKREQAEQAASEALEWAETWLQGLDLPAPGSLVDMQQSMNMPPVNDRPDRLEQAPLNWWREFAFETGSYPQDIGKTPSPNHFQEAHSLWLVLPLYWQPAALDESQGPRAWYRIVARGSHSDDASVSVMESVLVRSWPPDQQAESTDTRSEAYCVASPEDCGRRAWRKLR